MPPTGDEADPHILIGHVDSKTADSCSSDTSNHGHAQDPQDPMKSLDHLLQLLYSNPATIAQLSTLLDEVFQIDFLDVPTLHIPYNSPYFPYSPAGSVAGEEVEDIRQELELLSLSDDATVKEPIENVLPSPPQEVAVLYHRQQSDVEPIEPTTPEPPTTPVQSRLEGSSRTQSLSHEHQNSQISTFSATTPCWSLIDDDSSPASQSGPLTPQTPCRTSDRAESNRRGVDGLKPAAIRREGMVTPTKTRLSLRSDTLHEGRPAENIWLKTHLCLERDCERHGSDCPCLNASWNDAGSMSVWEGVGCLLTGYQSTTLQKESGLSPSSKVKTESRDPSIATKGKQVAELGHSSATSKEQDAKEKPPSKDLVLIWSSLHNYITDTTKNPSHEAFVRRVAPNTNRAKQLEMLRLLSLDWDKDYLGYLYMFWKSSNAKQGTTLVKLGYSKDPVTRVGQWQRQCSYAHLYFTTWPAVGHPSRRSSPFGLTYVEKEWPSPNDSSTTTRMSPSRVPEPRRTERLVHLALSDKKAVLPTCRCGVNHREWFEITTGREEAERVDRTVREIIAFVQDMVSPKSAYLH